MAHMAKVIRALALLAILILCLCDGVVMTKFAILDAEQTGYTVTSVNLIKVWIFPFILIAASLISRNSTPKLIIFLAYVATCLFLNVSGYRDLKADVPFAGAFDMVLQVFLFIALVLPLLIMAHALEPRSSKTKGLTNA